MVNHEVYNNRHMKRYNALEGVFLLFLLYNSVKIGHLGIISATLFVLAASIIRAYELYWGKPTPDKDGMDTQEGQESPSMGAPLFVGLVLYAMMGLTMFFLKEPLGYSMVHVIRSVMVSVVILGMLLYESGIMWRSNKFHFRSAIANSGISFVVMLTICINLMMISQMYQHPAWMETMIHLFAAILGLLVWGILSRYETLLNEKNRQLFRTYRENRMLIFTRLSLRKDLVLALIKGILALISLSAFMFANMLYTIGMAYAKYIAIKGQNEARSRQIHGYFMIGWGVMAAGVCYVLYTLRLFEQDRTPAFSFIPAVLIVLYTLTELYLIIRDFIRARRAQNMIAEQIKLIGLASTLILMPLCQSALMAVIVKKDTSMYIAFSGILFGLLATLVGLGMIIRSRRLREKLEEASLSQTE